MGISTPLFKTTFCITYFSSCLTSSTSGADSIIFLSLILLVTHVLHPISGLTGFLLHNGDMRHGRRWRGTMPMLFARMTPDHISRPDLLNRTIPALDPPAAGCHDQSLTQRVTMPGGSSARLECHAGTGCAR